LSGLIDTVRELRALTGCGLAVALGYVREGWKIGDPIDQSLLTSRDEAQAAKLRLERAAPALLAACKRLLRLECPIGSDPLDPATKAYWLEHQVEGHDGAEACLAALDAITAATHPAQAPVEEE
jgi:hypothetical protein